MITSDVGVQTTVKIIERIESRVAKDKFLGTSELNSILREEISELCLKIILKNYKTFLYQIKGLTLLW